MIAFFIPLMYNDRVHNFYPGVAQLVARLLWEQDAASSSLATWTIQKQPTLVVGSFLYIPCARYRTASCEQSNWKNLQLDK